MRIVIEGYPYDGRRLREVVPAGMPDFPDREGEIRVPYVGYCFNPAINDCVFFLPKVVLTPETEGATDDAGRGLVLGRYHPHALLERDCAGMDGADRRFLNELAVWIYRAVSVFSRNNDTTVVSRHECVDAGCTARTKDATLVDIILSLMRFARENRDFMLFEIRNLHRGHDRVDWRRTVARRTPLMRGRTPVYPEPVNRRKQIDFDEELFVIYHSILDHVRRQYGFRVETEWHYEPIGAATFRHYLAGYGAKRLRQIKYKYFSDKSLELWNLCNAFFSRAERLNSSRLAGEWLVARDFDIVFESMVDSLLGESVPAGFREQADGKRIDHIYRWPALVGADALVYHIADSKYYRLGARIDRKSVYKQYTYARNVIQRTLEIGFGDGTDDEKRAMGHLPYRDVETEGYTVSPNFFISAKIAGDGAGAPYSYATPALRPHDVDLHGEPRLEHRIFHFENRLFDRDTLILSHYDINFLYLTALYGKGNVAEQSAFRRLARKTFRDGLLRLLERYYSFYRVDYAPEGVKAFVERNFRQLAGKLFHFDGVLVMALERGHAENAAILSDHGHRLTPYHLR